MITREQPVYVKLKGMWMGRHPGEVIPLNKRMAQSLFQRDVGEIMEPDKPQEIKKKLQRREHDKMVKSSYNK